MKRLLILLAMLSIFPAFAETASESEQVDSEVETQVQDFAEYEEETPSIRWIFDLPPDYSNRFPVHKSTAWAGEDAMIGGGTRVLHIRYQNSNDDELHFGGYLYFRPVIIDFGNSNFSFGAFFSFNRSWSDLDTELSITNSFENINSSSDSINLGFSGQWSIPEAGIQMVFEFGHTWRRVKSRINAEGPFTTATTADAIGQVPPFPPGFPANVTLSDVEVTNAQNETGINFFYSLLYLRENTNIFSGFKLSVTGGHRTGNIDATTTVETSASVTFPLLPPPNTLDQGRSTTKVKGDESRTGFAFALLNIRALTIPLMEMDNKEFGISFEPSVGIGHFAFDDGHFWSVGGRISIFEALAFSYLRSFEQQNDGENTDLFALEAGIRFGRTATAVN